MKYVGYLFFRFITFLFALMPFRVMYLLSDFTAFMLSRVVKYRRNVIYDNLRNSFPEKSPSEIDAIAKGAYRNLADITLEGIKCFSMNEKSIRERYIFTNPELLDNSDRAGGNSIVLAAHYGNWEWGAMGLPVYFKKHIVGFYKPLSNIYIEKYGFKSRTKLGTILISIGKTAWGFENYKHEPSVYFLVSDQNPASDSAHWVDFLNQNTACPIGGDKYARLYNYPVYFANIQRQKRGFYTVTIEELVLNPNDTPIETVTQIFMKRVEKIIIENPQDWLWSHKRWKMKKIS